MEGLGGELRQRRETSEAGSEESETVEPEVECPVCMKLLVEATSTPCGHTFCKLCLEEAYLRKPSCPLCREPISSEHELKEDRILRKLIAKLYPRTSAVRHQEVENLMAEDDLNHWRQRMDELSRNLCEGAAEGTDIPTQSTLTRSDVCVFWQNPTFALPCPGEEEEIYLENPQLKMIVDDIFRLQACGCILATWPVGRYLDGPQVGVLVRMIGCTLLSPSSSDLDNPSWVPRRLKLQRLRFRDNKLELYPGVRQSCVVRVRGVGKVRFHATAADMAAAASFVVASEVEPLCERNGSSQNVENVRLKATTLRSKILTLRADVGQAGQLLYARRYGDVAVVPVHSGISQLEEISYSYMVPLAILASLKNQMICEMDTAQRIAKIIELLDSNGSTMLRMGLSQSTSRDWLNKFFLGGWNQSIALLVIIAVALLVVRLSGGPWSRSGW